MNYDETTINDLFQYDQFQEEHLLEIENKEKVKNIRKEVGAKKPQLIWKKVINEVLGNSGKLLNIKLSDILKGGWEKYQEVYKYLDEKYKEKDDVFLVPLLEHIITSKHQPKVKVQIGESTLGIIDFEINIKIKLKGTILKISHAEIIDTEFGSVKFEGAFSCEDILLWEEKSKELKFKKKS